MSRYTVRVRGAAAREYERLSGEMQGRALAALEALEDDPRPPGVKQLAGELQGLHRVRVGGYRIVYQIDDAQRLVNVVRIRPRGRAYK
ncbi:MAG: type II toxin-antitoxin system RelE/ParE family toxin [Armatimonadetes bacterium]|nr:type II toxin-antitoxin system RelE/ParE family toxin [Armatimonadota bacterium]